MLFIRCSVTAHKLWHHLQKAWLLHLAASGRTLTTSVRENCTKRKGASNMNIHHDVTGLLSAVWKVTLRSACLGRLSWPARRGGCIFIAHMRDIKESASSRQLDR